MDRRSLIFPVGVIKVANAIGGGGISPVSFPQVMAIPHPRYHAAAYASAIEAVRQRLQVGGWIITNCGV